MALGDTSTSSAANCSVNSRRHSAKTIGTQSLISSATIKDEIAKARERRRAKKQSRAESRQTSGAIVHPNNGLSTLTKLTISTTLALLAGVLLYLWLVNDGTVTDNWRFAFGPQLQYRRGPPPH